MNGKVYLVGAGPGDPELITLKGLSCIQKADVIIYDFLASPRLLAHAAKRAEILYVGKKGGDHTLSQERINALIVEKASQGRTVARLKGGDPYIFGRGGEEAEVLVDAGIPYEVVPGVTSAIAAPAYAGIPLTHRAFTSTVGFVTGHEDPTKGVSGIEWEALAKGMGTLVFLMGMKNLPHLVSRLTAAGLPETTPVALVRWGTTPEQVTLTGTLGTIHAAAAEAALKPPVVMVVGAVVGLREKLAWFEKKPLFGKRIVVTRAREQASDLVQALSDLGARCLEYPTIRIAPLEDDAPLDAAIDGLSRYDWLVFTSVNGVRAFFDRLFHKGKDVRALGHVQTAVIGPATQKKLFEYGLKSDIVPESFRAESVAAAFSQEALRGRYVLLPRAMEARSVLPDALRQMGANVEDIPVYRTETTEEAAGTILTLLEEKGVDMITFTSSSTVKHFRALLPGDRFDALMEGVVVASIGPITTDTARGLGFTVHVTADTFTIPGLVEAILQYQSTS
ncbi:MAG: uroporphyrinogen-III C-methyltransferase [Deltaproteobacteria bacterium]|nr:uroporphyrinogen-III C-methyltransferase [Deltaproteobacteria bacterium]MBW2041500.1 uroporphyrinogen-III C-methyltransferase [Deltaproteobacteria bacterium]MBW2131609.1 uroporphyrinogen-III C-methyltransferase [Deltaproteobacteria bacterium]